MIGAYIGIMVATHGGGWWIALLASGLVVAIIGVLMDKAFFSRLYKRINDQVLLSLGFVYIFANAALWIWGPWPKTSNPPSFLEGSVTMGTYSITVYRLALIIIGAMIFLLLLFLQERTRVGAIIRAGLDDKQMVTGSGINYTLVSTMLFAVGAFMGGLAGYLGAPILGVQPEIGFDITLLAVIIIIVGGVGRVQGALLGALTVGIIDSFGKAFFPFFAHFTPYIVLILVLLFRPLGIMGKKQ